MDQAESTNKKRISDTILVRLPPREFTVEEMAKREVLFSLASSLGFTIQDLRGVKMDLAQHLYSRLTNRVGKAIHQSICFSLSLSMHAAQQIFPEQLITSKDATQISWRANNLVEVRQLIGNLLSMVAPSMAAGLTRAVRPPSEKVTRVFAVLMPPVEIQAAQMQFGAERLYFNSAYVLFDDTATLHPPYIRRRT